MRLPKWIRVMLVVGGAFLAIGAGLFAYRYFTYPKTLTIAVGSLDGEGTAILTTIATRLAASNAPVRLKVMDTGSPLEAAKAFSAGKAELAVARSDIGDLSTARAVVTIGHVVVMILVPAGSSIDSIDDLSGKSVGVVGGQINQGVVTALKQGYEKPLARTQFRDLTLAEAAEAIEAKRVSALIVVVPLTQRYLAIARGLLAGKGKSTPTVLAIDSAEAIAGFARAYESFDLPKGTLRGSPPVPDDDLTTIRVPIYIVANKKLDDDTAAELAKAIMEVRRELVGAYPLLAQVSAPETEKDAFMPAHPGAATYFNGEQQGFFEKYGDALFYGPMFLGGLLSAAAGAWKFMGIGAGAPSEGPLGPFHSLASRIRAARSEAELAAIEDEIGDLFVAKLADYGKNDAEKDAAAWAFAAQGLEHLIDRRRSTLAVPQDRPSRSIAGPVPR